MKPLLVVFVATATLSAQTTDEFRADFDFALQRIGATYAYFEISTTAPRSDQ